MINTKINGLYESETKKLPTKKFCRHLVAPQLGHITLKCSFQKQEGIILSKLELKKKYKNIKAKIIANWENINLENLFFVIFNIITPIYNYY